MTSIDTSRVFPELRRRARQGQPLTTEEWAALAVSHEFDRIEAALRDDCPTAILTRFLADPAVMVRYTAVTNPKLPATQRLQIADGAAGLMLIRLCRNPGLDEPAARRIAEQHVFNCDWDGDCDSNHDVVVALASNQHLAPTFHEWFAEYGYGHELYRSQYWTPVAVLDAVALASLHDRETLVRLLKHPNAAGSTVEHVSLSMYEDVKVLCAKHPEASEQTLVQLSTSSAPAVQEAVLRSRACPAAALAHLSATTDRDFRRRVFEHPNCPPEVQVVLTFGDPPEYVTDRGSRPTNSL